MKVEWQRGVLISTAEERIHFDPQQRKKQFDRIFVSHSHGDHTAAFYYDAVKYSTSETRSIFETRSRRNVGNFKAVQYDRAVKVGSVEVIPRNAGHILGSTQFEVRTPEETVVYTGDINCRDTLTTRAATPIECDTLIIESTYGNPTFLFPSREEVYVEIAKWTTKRVGEGKIPVFEVYSVGKAQEIIAVLNYFTKLPVVVNPTISRVNEIHRKSGIELRFIDANSLEGQEVLKRGDCCYVVPPARQQDLPANAVRATATGWNVKFRPRKYDGVFPLSSHADFNQLLSYIEAASPSLVYTCFSNSRTFPLYITKKTGIKSSPLNNERKSTAVDAEKMDKQFEIGIQRVLDLVATPGFVYREKWIIDKLKSSKFNAHEVRKVLNHMKRRGIITYERDLKGYRLT